MPAPFPHHYKTQLRWNGDATSSLEAAPRPAITGGAPPEFDGTDRLWSPEHLFISSVGLCLMLTFQSVARKSRLSIKSYKSECTGTVDRGDGGLAFTAIHLHVDITVADADDVERVRPLLDTAKKYCLVSNSIKAPVTLAATVTAVSLD
jgi:organic hydroperoxide reductase OsmC/OhrA